jgi:BA14K-like protein
MGMKRFIAATLLVAAAAFPAGQGAKAAPVKPEGLTAAVTADVVLAGHRDHGMYWYHGNPYYNGHRGYRHPRHGYRFFGGYWFPPHAFSYGVIIIVPPYQRTYNLTERHFRWCERRYRSYRRWDNTFQPYHGPRRQCGSPYMY